MNIKQKTLNEVYEHLHNHCGLHTKSDFADILEVKRAGLYSAMNGNEAYLTDSLFRRICTKFQGMFDINYLLTGEGTLLLPKNDGIKQTTEKINEIDQKDLMAGVENLLQIAATQIKDNEELRRELRESIQELRELISAIKAPASKLYELTTPTVLTVAELEDKLKK